MYAICLSVVVSYAALFRPQPLATSHSSLASPCRSFYNSWLTDSATTENFLIGKFGCRFLG